MDEVHPWAVSLYVSDLHIQAVQLIRDLGLLLVIVVRADLP